MRNLVLIATAIASLAAMAGPPAMAGSSFKYIRREPYPLFCIAPAQLENECVAWGPAGPGELFGPCLKYQLKCMTPPNIQ